MLQARVAVDIRNRFDMNILRVKESIVFTLSLSIRFCWKKIANTFQGLDTFFCLVRAIWVRF